jgi:hypothetical protein
MSRKLEDETYHNVNLEHLVACENYFYLSKRTNLVSTCLTRIVCNTAMFWLGFFQRVILKLLSLKT